MTRQLLPIVGFGLLATLGVVIALIVAPDRRDVFLDLYVLALGGIAVIRLLGLTRRRRAPGERSEFDDALRLTVSKATRIAERDKLAREVGLGTQTAFTGWWVAPRSCRGRRGCRSRRRRARAQSPRCLSIARLVSATQAAKAASATSSRDTAARTCSVAATSPA